jgi:hypothetical protein
MNMTILGYYMHHVVYFGVLIRSSFGGVCEHTESLLTANKKIDLRHGIQHVVEKWNSRWIIGLHNEPEVTYICKLYKAPNIQISQGIHIQVLYTNTHTLTTNPQREG